MALWFWGVMACSLVTVSSLDPIGERAFSLVRKDEHRQQSCSVSGGLEEALVTPLNEYRKKRKFDVTSEPKGGCRPHCTPDQKAGVRDPEASCDGVAL